ncbi:hypothetical protein G7Y79_00080g100530 [Physcia stellaris]|nr:hypothetical protein G7Y79_00080g100530 [Physcia stellaris]
MSNYPHDAISFADNVSRAMQSMTSPTLPPEFHRASLYFITLRLRAGDLPTTDIAYLWDVTLVYKLPNPTPSRNAVLMYNKLGWTEWTAPFITRWPFPFMGQREERIPWAELQALMSLEEADRRRRDAGYVQPISRVWIAHAGREGEHVVLGYWFELDFSMSIRVDARTGEVDKFRG